MKPAPGWRGRWGPVVAYTALIFALSSIQRPPPAPGGFQADKFLHVGEYAVLGWLLGRATGGRRFAWVVVAGSLIGGLDELYQHTVPGRLASLADVAADVAGVLAGCLARAWRARGGGP